jgi:hypothetical protein
MEAGEVMLNYVIILTIAFTAGTVWGGFMTYFILTRREKEE